MIILNGKYNNAEVFTDNIDNETISQIIELLNQEFVKNCKIRIMPDCHKGAGCVIGFTANLGDKIIPDLVGVDIGCGMYAIELDKIDLDLPKLDEIIHNYIPSGFDVHKGRVVRFSKLQELYCYRELKNTKRVERSLGTLGGGNHFIEIDKDDDANLYLVIHSGSRNLGKQVAEYYQNIAVELCAGKEKYYQEREELIKSYKVQGKKELIQKVLKQLDKKYINLLPSIPKDLCYLTGEFKDKYLHDMNICQEFAILNRETIANIILDKMFNQCNNYFNTYHTIHNYINFKDNIIRKGSISAYKNEKVLIPINMRDGSIVGIGKGNPNWNYSAPHGAGRLMSRSQAKDAIDIENFKKSMEGIYTTSVNESTLDESPFAYKSMKDILNYINDTIDVINIIKPIYNFKA